GQGRTFFSSSRRRHTRSKRDWSSDVCSSDLIGSPRWRGCRRCGTRCCKLPRSTAPRTSPSCGWRVRVVHRYRARCCASSPTGSRSEERRVGKSVGVGGRRRESRETHGDGGGG